MATVPISIKSKEYTAWIIDFDDLNERNDLPDFIVKAIKNRHSDKLGLKQLSSNLWVLEYGDKVHVNQFKHRHKNYTTIDCGGLLYYDSSGVKYIPPELAKEKFNFNHFTN